MLGRGAPGQSYAIGGAAEMRNIDVVSRICALLDERRPASAPHARLITFVADRRGHDRRYAIDDARMRRALGWSPHHSFATGLADTVDWYLRAGEWWRPLRMSSKPREAA